MNHKVDVFEALIKCTCSGNVGDYYKLGVLIRKEFFELLGLILAEI